MHSGMKEQGSSSMVEAKHVGVISLMAVAALVMCALATAIAGAHVGHRDQAGGPTLRSAMPKRTFVVLGTGSIGKRRWQAFAYRGSGSRGGANPCLLIASTYPSPDGGLLRQLGSDCGPLAPPAQRPIEKESGVSIQEEPSGPTRSSSVIGLIFDSSAQTVKLNLEPGPNRTERLKRLSTAQANKSHVRPLSYLALAIGHKVCLQNVTAFDSGGGMLFQSPERSCQKN